MNINIVARPDHSHKLFEQLISLKHEQVSFSLFTFYCLSEGSLASKMFPKLRTAPTGAHTLDFYTVSSRLTTLLLKRLKLNHRKFEEKLFEAVAPWASIMQCDLLHYWPFYCANRVRKLKDTYGLNTVVEYYEAEPSFVNALYQTEYDIYGIIIDKFGNNLINQNLALEFENDAIVASEFTAKSYRKKFPNVNFHVCGYGPSGFSLINKNIKSINIHKPARILYVGQVSLEKGVPYLLNAVSKLNVTVDLIGPVKPIQEDIFNKLFYMNKKCNYLGSMRNSEVLNLIENYDIFCLPSLSDNYSLAVVEALSRGLPVVVTDNCGNADDIIKFNLGKVAKVCNVDSIAEAIFEIQNNFDRNYFHAGLERFFSTDNKKNYPNSVFEVYKNVVSRNNSRK